MTVRTICSDCCEHLKPGERVGLQLVGEKPHRLCDFCGQPTREWSVCWEDYAA